MSVLYACLCVVSLYIVSFYYSAAEFVRAREGRHTFVFARRRLREGMEKKLPAIFVVHHRARNAAETEEKNRDARATRLVVVTYVCACSSSSVCEVDRCGKMVSAKIYRQIQRKRESTE